jgi:hypothetical protein
VKALGAGLPGWASRRPTIGSVSPFRSAKVVLVSHAFCRNSNCRAMLAFEAQEVLSALGVAGRRGLERVGQ